MADYKVTANATDISKPTKPKKINQEIQQSQAGPVAKPVVKGRGPLFGK